MWCLLVFYVNANYYVKSNVYMYNYNIVHNHFTCMYIILSTTCGVLIVHYVDADYYVKSVYLYN